MYQVKAEIITGQYAFNNIEEFYAHFGAYTLKESIGQCLNDGAVVHLEIRLLTANWVSVNITFHQELDFYTLMVSNKFREIKQYIDNLNWNVIITSKSTI
jgi:hypothetical protein